MKQIRGYDRRVLREIRTRAQALAQLSDPELLEAANTLRTTLQTNGVSTLERSIVVESFGLTTEALRRTSGKVYYDCQLLGGLVLATSAIAEMQTGEGKTVTCGLPTVLYGLTGKGVHVATTNAYLAERDHEELLPVFEKLGLSSALVQSEMSASEKQAAYTQDVTYGTGYEFGFDFLRDQLALRNQPRLPLGTRFLARLRGADEFELDLMQRPLAFAIIDEADSVLIDEATTPLIMSGSSGSEKPNPQVYDFAKQQADSLQETLDYTTDEIKQSIELTAAGWNTIHANLPASIQQLLQRPWSQYVEQALRAKIMLVRNTDYVVENNQIVLVDQNTGRLHDERKWRSGLHQAIETCEGVPLSEEREIEARITRQRYYGFYENVAGMTGTAAGNEAELLEFYNLPIVHIDRNKPSKRRVERARYFAEKESKYQAIADDAIARAKRGQPVLVGTRTITQSREIASVLEQKKHPHTTLNVTQDEDEADIISAAGAAGKITIATNMAGRGTDIKIHPDAIEAGGLHVIVAEHHDSPRVDRQLIGRCARQSDPGSCQFFVSADDQMIKQYSPQLARNIRRDAKQNGECKTSFDREINALQTRIERINFSSRKKMVVHDRWIESVQKSVAKLA